MALSYLPATTFCLPSLLFGQTSDILYYEVLDIPLPELQCLKTLKVAFYNAAKYEVSATHTYTFCVEFPLIRVYTVSYTHI